jgi:conjugal transfer pilus assembly protein TraV
VYANALADNLPGLQKKQHATTTTKTTEVGDIPTGTVTTTKNTATAPYSGTSSITGTTPSSGTPILTPQHVMRVWLAPWEDAEGDLHDQAYIYVVANSGHWAIAHNEQQIMNRYRPTFIKKSEQQAAQPGSTYEKKVTTNNDTPAYSSTLPTAQGYSPSAPTPSGLPSGIFGK